MKYLLLSLLFCLYLISCSDTPEGYTDICDSEITDEEFACVQAFQIELMTREDRWLIPEDLCKDGYIYRWKALRYGGELYFMCLCDLCNKVGQAYACSDFDNNIYQSENFGSHWSEFEFIATVAYWDE